MAMHFLARSSVGGWNLFSPLRTTHKAIRTLILPCLKCDHGGGVWGTARMLTMSGLLSDSSLNAEMLSRLNLRPEIHHQDPRDKVPTSVKTTYQSVSELPIMHVKATHNNTIITISDSQGKVITWTSAGAVGYKGARRGTNFAGQEAGAEAARKAIKLGMKDFQVKLKGSGPGRKPSLKGMEMEGINVIAIQDVTPVPHNGCKPRKARRL